jgi:hypothetical protein
MTAMSPDVTADRRRRVLRQVTIIVAAAAVILIGFLRADRILSSTTDIKAINTKAGANAALSPTAATRSATSDIVPSPVIETNPKFFLGTGDGSAGSYSE